jgi:hypothetical protein
VGRAGISINRIRPRFPRRITLCFMSAGVNSRHREPWAQSPLWVGSAHSLNPPERRQRAICGPSTFSVFVIINPAQPIKLNFVSRRTGTDLRFGVRVPVKARAERSARFRPPLLRLGSRLGCNPHDMGLPFKEPYDFLVFYRITIDDLLKWSARCTNNSGH